MTLAGAPAERDHEQAVGRPDREQVEHHGLERQEQRAERAHEHEVGEREHAEHEPGEGAVGAVDEVDARRRPAAGIDARRAEAAPGHVVVAQAAGRASWPHPCRSRARSRRRCARSGRWGRAAGYVGRPGSRRGLHDRDLGIGAQLRRRAARSPAPAARMPPARPLSTTAMSGVIVPGTERALEQLEALHRLRGCEGRPLLEPGVSESSGAGSAQSTQEAAGDAPATIAGRRMIVSAMRAQIPFSRSGRRPISGTPHAQPGCEPKIASRAGSSVSAAAIETSGMSRPPTPIERMNGSGMQHEAGRARSRRSRPRRGRPRARPCASWCASASGGLVAQPAEQLLAEAVDDEQRVVDRDRDPDQRDEVRARRSPCSSRAPGATAARASRAPCPAAISSGTSVAVSVPKTTSSTMIAIGIAIISPRCRSASEDGLQVVVDGDLPADVDPAAARSGAGYADRVCWRRPPRRRSRGASARRAAAPAVARGACRSARRRRPGPPGCSRPDARVGQGARGALQRLRPAAAGATSPANTIV